MIVRTSTAGALELQGLSGVALADGSVAMGVRLGCPHLSLGMFEGLDILYSLSEPPLHAPDSSWARVAWQAPVTAAGVQRYASRPRQNVNMPRATRYAEGEAATVALEWMLEDGVLHARYTATAEVSAALFAAGCFEPAQVAESDPECVVVMQGDRQLVVRLVGRTEKPMVVDDIDEAERAWFNTTPPEGVREAVVPVRLAPEHPLHLTMALITGDDDPDDAPGCHPREIDDRLQSAAAHYRDTRLASAGPDEADGAAEAVASLAAYSRCWSPGQRRVQTTVNRTWGGRHQGGLVFGWDNFFTSYIAAWEDPELAASSLEHIVRVYGENGIGGGPAQRNLIVPIVYCRTLDLLGDVGLARHTWPVMLDFLRFWFSDRGDGTPRRDPNRDGLIEPGTSFDPSTHSPGGLVQSAMDETGYDEWPVYSAGFTDRRRAQLADGVRFDFDTRCLDVTLIGQNALYVAACRKMAALADRLHHRDSAEWLRVESDRVAGRIRRRLYDPESGFFRDRRGDGSFSPVKGMTVFYPLLAGLADNETAERLRALLTDPNTFWGDNLIPTVSRDDPAYCDGLDGRGNYWRGNCWPPTTYIVWLALKEAGWHDLSAEYARRVARQFMTGWRRHVHACENYPAEGEVDVDHLYIGNWGGRELRYVWAALMPLCLLEEAFGPEATGDGWRFGNPHLGEAVTLRNVRCRDESLVVTAGRDVTRVACGDRWTLEARPGVVVRYFVEKHGGKRVRFRVSSEGGAQIALRHADFEPGDAVEIDGNPAPAELTNKTYTMKVSPGRHVVTVGPPNAL